MRTEQIRLAKATNQTPKELDGVDLIWYSIGRIEAMQAEIDRLKEVLSTVERWANHHASYADGVVPNTFDPYAELEELRKDRDLLQFCIDNDAFPVKDQSGAYIMSKNNEFFSVSEYSRKSIELAFEYAKYKTEKVMRGEK